MTVLSIIPTDMIDESPRIDQEEENPIEEEHTDENPVEDTNTDSGVATLATKATPYPVRVYQHTTAALKGMFPDKYAELERLRIHRGVKSINMLPEAKSSDEWAKASKFFHDDDAATRVLQRQWNKDNHKLATAKKAAAKRKREAKAKNERLNGKRGSKKSRRDYSSVSDDEEDDDDEEDGRHGRKRHHGAELEALQYFDTITTVSEDAVAQVVSTVLRAITDVSRQKLRKKHRN